MFEVSITLDDDSTKMVTGGANRFVKVLLSNSASSSSLAFGKLLEEIHVTWTQFGKKRDKIATLHEVAQYLETTLEILATPSQLTSDNVKIYVTTSECNRLNEALEDSAKRRLQDFGDA
ncbi:hypothetical protein Tco_0670744, partial [Tanacetum coccineum]